jgi:radical SAM superfamily enzyme YgiQ (UPF0313 family)
VARWKGSSKEQSFREYGRELLIQEKGWVPQKRGAPVRIALVYPNRYEVGMASLGFQTVYRLFNEHPEVRCERAFLLHAPFDQDIRTLESGERLDRFDLVGFSLSFELDFLNLIRCLMNAGIPLLAKDRKERDPLIFAGGVVVSLNPSPLFPFVDGLLVGEGEEVFHRMADVLFSLRKGKGFREDRLRMLGKIDGIFSPRLNGPVKRQILSSLEPYPTYTPIVTPLSHFENMFVVEVGRGCTKGCLFCAAQKVYHPYRFRSAESIVEIIAKLNPGSNRVGLEGAGLSDYPDLESLCETLGGMGYEVSLSSIRADRVTSELVEIVELVGLKSLTIAPEAGSERLRQSIGKGIKDDVLQAVVRQLGDSTIAVLKLYFLIGLPNETDEDVESIVDLVRELTPIFVSRDNKKRIRLSVNAFVPKPFTELQWVPMATERELSRKRKMIHQGLKSEKGVFIVPKSSRAEILQGVISLGDENVGLAMMDVLNKAIPWKGAIKERGMNIDTILHRERSYDAEFPWDCIHYEVSKERLWNRYKRHFN